MSETQIPGADRDFIRVGKSRIDGQGVFAKRRIPRGTRIIEYTGTRRATTNLFVQETDGKPAPVYTFGLREGLVIDGALGGNESRFINHGCEPNCEAYTFDDRIYIYAMRDIARGEELTFDYQLRNTSRSAGKSDIKNHPCRCGSRSCRGTMLSRKRRAVKP